MGYKLSAQPLPETLVTSNITSLPRRTDPFAATIPQPQFETLNTVTMSSPPSSIVNSTTTLVNNQY